MAHAIVFTIRIVENTAQQGLEICLPETDRADILQRRATPTKQTKRILP